MKIPLGLMAALLLTAVTVRADNITVGNNDFTAPATSTYFLAAGAGGSTVVPDWTFSDSESVGGLQSNSDAPVGQTAFFNSTSSADGSTFPLNSATYNGLNADSTTTALPTIAANTNYTLTVAVGVPTIGDSHVNYTIDLTANGVNIAAGSIEATSLSHSLLVQSPGYASGTFYDLFATLNASTIASLGLVGENLGINLETSLSSTEGAYSQTGNFSQTYFSDVRLTSQAAPEPSTYALAAFGFGALVLAVRARRLVAAN